MVLPSEIFITAEIQATAIASLRGRVQLDAGGSKRCYHMSYTTWLRYRLQVDCLSKGYKIWIKAEVNCVATKDTQPREI